MRGEVFDDDATRGRQLFGSRSTRVQIQDCGRGGGKNVGQVLNLPARFVVLSTGEPEGVSPRTLDNGSPGTPKAP